METDSWIRSTPAAAERISAFLWKVYAWMGIGLGITAVVAYMVASSPELLRALVLNRLAFFALIIAELGLVFFISARATSMTPQAASGLFALYSALNGVTLSVVLIAYTGESVATTFMITAGMFGAMALWGSTTRRSLAGMGQFMFMGLIGLVHIAYHSLPSVSPESKTVRMCGCWSRAAISISRRKRSGPTAAPTSGRSTLIATWRPCFGSWARYTVAMAP
jgi:FtsH-binding integral membrane protein